MRENIELDPEIILFVGSFDKKAKPSVSTNPSVRALMLGGGLQYCEFQAFHHHGQYLRYQSNRLIGDTKSSTSAQGY